LTTGILLTITAAACEGMAAATIMPSVATELGGLDGYGWAFSLFMLASLVGAIGAGEIADRSNPAHPARVGFACFAIGLVIAGAAPAWPLLLFGRAVQGLGAGALTAVAYVAVARGYPEALRPRLLALLSSAWIVPALVGPALAGLVAERATWRFVFIGILPAVALGACMLLPHVARLAPPAGVKMEKGRVAAALRLVGGLGLVLLAASFQNLLIVAVLAGVGLLLATPALRALLPPGTFAGAIGAPSAVALRGLLAFGFFAAETVIPLGLTVERGIPPSLVGVALTAGALAWVGGSWVQDRAESASSGSLAQRAMRVVVGLLLIASGTAVAALAIVSPALPVELVIVAWGLAGLGMGLAYPASTLTALGLAPDGKEGSAAASLQVAETVGIATGTGAVGALVALSVHLQRGMSDGLLWGFGLAGASILIALVPAFRLAPSSPAWPARWWPKPTT
jgi:MFS family permease